MGREQQPVEFGYRLGEDGRREKHQEEQHIIQDLYRRLLDGASREDINSAVRELRLSVPEADVLAAVDALIERRRARFAWGPGDLSIVNKD